MKKIWWFKRLKDNKYHPYDNEGDAGREMEKVRKGLVEYVGWSDGKGYDKVMKGHLVTYNPNSPQEGLNEEQISGAKYKKRKELVTRAYWEEIKFAQENPDKTPPNYDAGVVWAKGSQKQAIKQMMQGKI